MQKENYVAPEFNREAFHCPHCNAFAHQVWAYLGWAKEEKRLIAGKNTRHEVALAIMIGVSAKVSKCDHCNKLSYWIDGRLVYPAQITAPIAHEDMPKPVLEYYNEAREVSVPSPRAAAALLRIAAKKLCETLGENEPNLNKAIGNLRKKGLPQKVIQSLDTVRIVGNEGGAHEGRIDLSGKDSKEIVDKLFWLINFIVEKTISEPREVENSFQSLPEDKKQGAENRDKGNDKEKN